MSLVLDYINKERKTPIYQDGGLLDSIKSAAHKGIDVSSNIIEKGINKISDYSNNVSSSVQGFSLEPLKKSLTSYINSVSDSNLPEEAENKVTELLQKAWEHLEAAHMVAEEYANKASNKIE